MPRSMPNRVDSAPFEFSLLLRALLDHQMLDHIEGLGRPTLENLHAYMARHAAAAGLPLSGVAVWRVGIGDRCSPSLTPDASPA